MKGKLYLVATPIGNLEDITLRAIRILGEVDLIAAEDTRQSRKLLNHLAIKKPLTSYFQHNERSKGQFLIESLLAGQNIAVISDAGTPAISDPGSELVRLAIQNQIEIIPVPGPSACLTLLSASGLNSERFVFEGFLPRQKNLRRQRLLQLLEEERTLIFYEAPHRLRAFLADVNEILGDRELAIGRELTKRFEEILRGSISELRGHFEQVEPRGEFVVAITGCQRPEQAIPADEDLRAEMQFLLARGQSRKQAAKEMAQKYNISAKKAYDLTVKQ
jgi:16S rRNA (cytidine1402-2'-O)-methyltransferase